MKMNRHIVSIILLLALSASVHAATADWQWDFNHRAYFGTAAGASDSLDPLDKLLDHPFTICVATHHEEAADDWDGPTGLYSHDIRAPLSPIVGQSKTWTLYLWATPAYPAHYEYLALSWFGSLVPESALAEFRYSLTYVRSAAGALDEMNLLGTSVILNDRPDGGEWWLPAYRTDNGLDGYIFELKATVIPEPSALAALGTGLAALGIRRRRSGTRRDMDVPRNSGGGHG